MNKLVRVKIKPPDWGTKVRVADTDSMAGGRMLRLDRAAKYAKDIDAIAKNSVLKLMEDARGGYTIIDGQHRLYAACVVAKKTFEWMAIVFPYDKDALARLIVDNYIVIPVSLSDKLRGYVCQSPWPRIVTEAGIEPLWVGGKSSLTWGAILRGYYLYKRAKRLSRKPAGGYKDDGLMDCWLLEPEQSIKWATDVLSWWEVGAEIAKGRKIYAMRSYLVLSWAFTVVDQNSDSVRLYDLPTKIAESPQLHNITGASGANTKQLFEILLGIANHKNRTCIFSIFGDTGREIDGA